MPIITCMAKQREQSRAPTPARNASLNYNNGYVYHRALFQHTGHDDIFIRRMGHLARLDPIKSARAPGGSQLDPSNWNIHLYHEDVICSDGRRISADCLFINNVDHPIPKMENNPLHSWIRLCGNCCPSIWQDLGYTPGAFVTGIDSNRARQNLHNIYRELIEHTRQDPMALIPLVQLFLYDCQRSVQSEDELIPNEIQQVLYLLSEDEGLRMSVEALATAAGCSSRQLSRLCKKYLLRSPIEIRREQRLLRATELLDDPQRNLSGIAEQVGYSDAFSLSKAYRKAYGHSPRG